MWLFMTISETLPLNFGNATTLTKEIFGYASQNKQ